MQGRLSPVIDGKIQAFPAATWREEFEYAEKIGFNLIEWVLDSDSIKQNPIFYSEGRKEILFLKDKHGIDITSICCDYFMDVPLTSIKQSVRKEAKNCLIELIKICGKLNIKFIELPLVGQAEIKTKQSVFYLSTLLEEIKPLLEEADIFILLELNLDPEAIINLLRKLNSTRVLINYDTGNSAYWGFNPVNEIPLYGEYIANVHIKDCTKPDYSVFLGKGDVDFQKVFELLEEIDYQGDFILQTSREEEDYLAAKDFYDFTNNLIKEYLSGSKS